MINIVRCHIEYCVTIIIMFFLHAIYRAHSHFFPNSVVHVACVNSKRSFLPIHLRQLADGGGIHAKVFWRRTSTVAPPTAAVGHFVLRWIQSAIILGHGHRIRYILWLLRVLRSEFYRCCFRMWCAFSTVRFLFFNHFRGPAIFRCSGNTMWRNVVRRPSGNVNRIVTCPGTCFGIR